MNKKLKVSVAGIRGEYPEVLTPALVRRFSAAFGRYTKEKKVFIGRDTRPSGAPLQAAVTAGLLASGKNVVDAGIIPTPALGFLLEKLERGAGVMVSASHNPLPYNGLKFFSRRGTFLTEREGAAFLKVFNRKDRSPAVKPGLCTVGSGYLPKAFEAVYRAVGRDAVRRARLSVVVDCGCGVAALSMKDFLRGMGCAVTLLYTRPLGKLKPDPEPRPENLGALCRAVRREKADIGFAVDPDGDRLAVVSEQGRAIGEELTIVLAVEAVLRRKKGPVAVNLSTTALVDEVAREFGVPVYRAKVGEVNVVEKMWEKGAVIGGEGNGGVIWPTVHYGRDAYVGAALILNLMAARRATVSELAGRRPAFCMYKEKFAAPSEKVFARLRKHFADEKQDNFDGLKIYRDSGWIHLRISGTEGVLRVIVEGKDKSIANNYLREVDELLR